MGSRFICVSTTTMKFPVFLFCLGLSAAAIVKREADAEADADADAGVYASHGGYASAPVCTVVTETCEEIVRTVCTQSSETASHHSHVVDTSSRLVEAEAEPGYGYRHSAPIRRV